MKKFLYSFFFLFLQVGAFAQIKFNEIQPTNTKTILDPDYGKNADWIELYNTSTSTVNISGYYITDDASEPRKWKVPTGTSIPAKGYLVIWADGKNTGLHTNFKLSSDGEKLKMYASSMLLLDTVAYGDLDAEVIWGRKTDGTGTWDMLAIPTPGKTNNATLVKGIAPKPTFSVPAGFYSTNQTVSISSSIPGAVIRYTTDGSEPTASSPIYTGPITAKLTNKTTQKYGNDRADKTGIQKYSWPVSLSYPVDKYTGTRDYGFVIKAKVFHTDYLPSYTNASTYFITIRKPSLPVVSMSTDYNNFFSADSGIYIQGTKGATEIIDGQNLKANWYQDWERKVFIEYFDASGTKRFGISAGAQTMGAVSRNFDLKSLVIAMKSKYEKGEIDYPLFGSQGLKKYSAFLLRNSGNDWESGCMARDAIIQSVLRGQVDLETQAYQPVVMFLNGEYWGLINMRERYDAEYFSRYHENVKTDEIDLLKLRTSKYFDASEGDTLRYKEMLAYLAANPMSVATNYDYVKKHYIDVDNMMNYYIAQLFCQNTDWPGNNARMWRPRYENGKFRFPIYDTDFGYGLYGGGSSMNSFSNLTGSSGAIAKLYKYMILSPEFKADFIQRYAYMLNTTYAVSRLTTIANDIEDKIANERDVYNDDEWTRSSSPGFSTKSMIDWGTSRISNVRSNIDSQYGYEGFSTLTVKYSSSQGSVKLAGLYVAPDYAGKQYNSTQIRLNAIAADGYLFSRWEDGSGTLLSTNQEYFLTITESYTVKAVFEARPTVANVKINEVMTSNNTTVKNDLGSYEDWIELYNAGTTAIDVAGLYISDKSTIPTLHKIPFGSPSQTTIPAGGYLVLWADGQTQEGALHLPFKLSKDGDTLLLSQKSASGTLTTIDKIIYGTQNTDISYGRYPDASSNKIIFTVPTPNASNSIQSVSFIDGLKINEIMAKNSSVIKEETGLYADYVEIYNSNNSAVDIGGLFVTNDLSVPNKYMIPKGMASLTTIPAKGYFILWADKQPEINPNHLDFNLGADKGAFAIVQVRGSENYFIDSLSYSNQGEDISYGRLPDITGSFKYMVKPTPGSANKNDTTVALISDLRINEALTINTKTKADEFGEYDDYIEFYNGSTADIDLGGLFITDTMSQSLLYRIPRTSPLLTTVKPGKWITFWADKKKSQGALHLDFALSSEGEELILSQVTENGIIRIDSMTFGKQSADVSYGCFPEKSNNKELMNPSYNAKNTSVNDIAYLKNITSTVGSLSTTISNSVFNYKILLPEGTTQVPVLTAIPVFSNEIVSIVQAQSINDVAIITVISPSGQFTNQYTVSFGILPSTDATLKSLTVSNSTLSPAFSSNTVFYTATTTSAIVPLLTAVPNNSHATVSIAYASALSANTVITVTAESGTTKEYTISYSFTPTTINQWTDNFDDNLNQNISTTSSIYTITEANQGLSVHLVRNATESTSDFFSYKIPSNFILSSNPDLYVSFDAICTSNVYAPTNKNVGLRVEVVDANGHTSNMSAVTGTIPGTKTTFNLDFTGTLDYQSGSTTGTVDKTKIKEVRFFFDYQNTSSSKDKTVVIDNLIIGPLTPVVLSSNADLSSLIASVGTISPVFAAATTSYTLTLPAGTTTIPTISATAAQANASIQITQPSAIDGTAIVRVLAQDKSTLKIYTVKLNVTPTVVEGYIEDILRPDMPGWSVGNNTYSLKYNAGALDVTYNRTSTSGNDAFTYNMSLEAFKILNLTNYPYFAIKAKTSVALNLRADFYDGNGYITNSSPVVIPISGSSDSLYIFKFTSKFTQISPSATVDVTKLYGVKLYFDAGSTTAKTGLVQIDKLLFGSEVMFAINAAPVIASIPSQTIMQGQSFNNILLNNFVSDDNTPVNNLKWTVSSPSNLTVTLANNIATIAVKNQSWLGTETVTFSVTDEAGETSSKVVAFTVTELKVPVNTVSFTSTSVAVAQNATANLKSLLQINPSTATLQSITWSSNSSNAEVDVNGIVTNKLQWGTETATITVTVIDKSNNVYTSAIKVVLTGCPTQISSVNFSSSSVSVTEGQTIQLNVLLTPSTACIKTTSFTSSATSVATVASDGKLTAVAPGASTITVSYNDGFTTKVANCLVTVLKDCSGAIVLSLDKKTSQLVKGYKDTLHVSFTPANECTANKVLTWTSANPSIATVNNGVVTAVAVGTVKIYTQTDGTGTISDTCVYTIIPDCYTGDVTITLNNQNVSLYKGETAQLTASVSPANACDKTLIWSSSDPTIASVSDGLVSAKNFGTVTISATSFVNSQVVSKATVVVEKRLPTSVSIAATLGLVEGTSQSLMATILPSNCDDNTLTWSSSNVSIATVDKNGKITAVAPGISNIMVTTVNGFKSTCVLTVTKLVIPVTGISISNESITVQHLEGSLIDLSFIPTNATDLTYTSVSSDINIVQVDGLAITAKKVGMATITVTSNDGGYSKKVTVTVTPILPSFVSIPSTLGLTEGTSQTISASILPSNSDDNSLTWTTSDASVATIDQNGKLTAVAEGTADIIVSTVNGFKDTCVLNVSKLIIPVTDISVTTNSIEIIHYKSATIGLTFNPTNATDQTYTIVSSDPSVVSVNGLTVTGVSVGNASVTIKSNDGGFEQDVSVTVKPILVSSVSIPSSLVLFEGSSQTISATVLPSNSDDKNLTWKSLDKVIAVVSASGEVTAIAMGTTSIVVTTSNGLTDTCLLTVNSVIVPVKGISVSNPSISLQPGQTADIDLIFDPINATDQSYTISSDNETVASLNGLTVIANKVGTANITIKTTDGDFVKKVLVTVNPILVKSVTLSSDSIALIVKDVKQLAAVVLPQNATDGSLTWTSSDLSIATVDQTGKVTAVNKGDAVISASSVNNVVATCKIHVLPIEVASISLNKNKMTLNVGDVSSLYVSLLPIDAENKTIIWASSNASVASVSNGGQVTAFSEGSAIISATSANGLKAECNVTVVKVNASSITLNKIKDTLLVYATDKLVASILPLNTTDKTVNWITSDKTIVTVTDGTITAVKSGLATISVTTSNGLIAICEVVVKDILPTAISASVTSSSMNIGTSQSVSVQFTPTNTTATSVSYLSSNSAIAVVDNTGKITAKSAGIVQITITTSNGISKEISITVNPNIETSISLNMSTVTLAIGESQQLQATILPADASDKSVTWSSSDSKVADVDATGKVTANSSGSVTITATSVHALKATANVTVKKITIPVTSVKLNKDTVVIKVGESTTLSASILPSDATNKSIIWSSDKLSVAIVDGDGLISAKAVGQANIIATASNGLADTCVLIVKTNIIPVSSFVLSNNVLNIYLGETKQLTGTITPTDATNQSIEWVSSSPLIANIDGVGNITGASLGSTIITATVDGISKECVVYVNPVLANEININLNYLGLGIGQSQMLLCSFVPSNTTDKNVKWTIANSSIATITSFGRVDALAEGSTMAYATASNGVKDSCIIVVSKINIPAENISVINNTETLDIDKSTTISVLFYPENTTNTSLSWVSADTNIVEIDFDGKITALKAGSTTVTATTVNGLSVKVDVVVNPMMAQMVLLNKTLLNLNYGQTAQLVATVLPEKTSDKTITWESADPSVVSVDKDGNITTVAAGTTNVIVSTVNGKQNICQVTVNTIKVQEVNISMSTIDVALKQSDLLTDSVILEATVEPSNATDATIKWESSDTNVVKVTSKGVVYYVGFGKATITATSSNDITATTNVSVVLKNNAPVLELAVPEQKIKKGESFSNIDLSTYVSDDNTASNKLLWSVNASAHISMSIDSKGVAKIFSIYPQWTGSETVTVYAKDEQGLSVSFTIVCTIELTQGINDNEFIEIKAYPNPTQGIVTVKMDAIKSNTHIVNVYNTLGDLIISKTITNSRTIETQIDLSGLVQGMYFIVITDGTKNYQTTVVRQ